MKIYKYAIMSKMLLGNVENVFQKLYKRLVNDTYRTIYSEKARAEIRFRYVLKILVLFLSILSVINYANNKIVIGNVTLSLTILYFICYWIVYFFKGKGTLIATVIMNVHLFLVATYVIILGTSDGISVVWIVLLPPACVLLIGLKYGSISAFAIIAELIFFFWTPFGNELVKYDYHSGFKIIFPMVIIVLYTFTFFFEFMREITIKALHREMSRIEEVYKYHHKELEGRIQETRSARHDMRQYLLVLNSLIEGGCNASQRRYTRIYFIWCEWQAYYCEKRRGRNEEALLSFLWCSDR